jgi:hypothetical protein
MSSQSQKLKKLNELESQLRKQSHLPLTGRAHIEEELQRAEADFKSLEIAYEQYFMGIERFEPSKERQILALRLRRLVSTHIPQVDVRYRLQNLNSRLQSYASYWDRILRLIEEGRYQRQLSHMKWAAKAAPGKAGVAANGTPTLASTRAADPTDKIYQELLAAHSNCQTAPPRREQVADFLKRQADAIRQRFGDRPVDMVVVVEDGKPKIKVRPQG